MNSRKSFRTVLRYASVYGWRRTLAKIAGRTRSAFWLQSIILPFISKRSTRHVSIIGCGQAAFATIAYYLAHHRGAVMLHAFDPERKAAESLAKFYKLEGAVLSVEELLNDPRCTHVYIASNHASHAQYTLQAIKKGKIVFTEKPMVTNEHDYTALMAYLFEDRPPLYVGYNRPFSPAIKKIVGSIRNTNAPFTLLCYVHGHKIPADHWYRNPEEGTRICGNAGHWIDLFVHIHAAVYGSQPKDYRITFSPSDEGARDDNFTLSINTQNGDLFTLVMTARSEPPLGVRELIELQCGSVSASIDDFKKLALHVNNKTTTTRYRRKDVGHRDCVLQPFSTRPIRSFREIISSTAIMLAVMKMALGQAPHTIGIEGAKDTLH